MDSATLRLLLLLLSLILAGGFYSFIVSLFTKNNWIRFLPTFLGIFMVIYLFFQAYNADHEGFLQIAYMLFIMMVVSVVIGNILGNIIFRNLPDRRMRK